MFIIAIFYIIGSNINKRILMSKLVRSLYYVEFNQNDKVKSVIKFTLFEKLKHMIFTNRCLSKSSNV